MPSFDRVIEVQRDRGSRDAEGEYVPNWQTEYTLWARRFSAANRRGYDVAPLIETGTVLWEIRYTEALATGLTSRLRVRDDAGNLWTIQDIQESDRRRRYLTIRAIRLQGE